MAVQLPMAVKVFAVQMPIAGQSSACHEDLHERRRRRAVAVSRGQLSAVCGNPVSRCQLPICGNSVFPADRRYLCSSWAVYGGGPPVAGRRR